MSWTCGPAHGRQAGCSGVRHNNPQILLTAGGAGVYAVALDAGAGLAACRHVRVSRQLRSGMSVRCPYCQHQMELKGAHAGRFTPKCPACKHRFVLLIPEDTSMPPLVGEMPAAQAGASQGSMAGASHAGLTAAGVNAIS